VGHFYCSDQILAFPPQDDDDDKKNIFFLYNKLLEPHVHMALCGQCDSPSPGGSLAESSAGPNVRHAPTRNSRSRGDIRGEAEGAVDLRLPGPGTGLPGDWLKCRLSGRVSRDTEPWLTLVQWGTVEPLGIGSLL
jgi:hypothetical protein